MNAERRQKAKEIYQSVLEQEPSQRAAFLEQACGGDDPLRLEVESLLACQTEAERLMASHALNVAARELAREQGDKPIEDLSGKSLLHYRVEKKIGEGGMGVVYRGRDERLKRDVAIKVLTETFAEDPERLARLEREARLLASVSHPNIAAIYGLEVAEDRRFLALEYVEGETLAQRLSKGPLPLEEALDVCRQIAEGVEAAHEKGIIHLDLKPANVKITPDGKVKVLDFGLAKAFSDETQTFDLTHSPTITEAMTKPGVILGTAAYMSPEPAKGKPVDKRTDIWALGCHLYECLTGKRAFPGETITETIAAILTHEPDWKMLPPSTPPALRKLLARCLGKNVNQRKRDASDLGNEIEELIQGLAEEMSVPAGAQPRRRQVHLIYVGALLVAVAGGVVIGRWHTPSQTPERMTISLSESNISVLDSGLAISPDGSLIVFSARHPMGRNFSSETSERGMFHP